MGIWGCIDGCVEGIAGKYASWEADCPYGSVLDVVAKRISGLVMALFTPNILARAAHALKRKVAKPQESTNIARSALEVRHAAIGEIERVKQDLIHARMLKDRRALVKEFLKFRRAPGGGLFLAAAPVLLWMWGQKWIPDPAFWASHQMMFVVISGSVAVGTILMAVFERLEGYHQYILFMQEFHREEKAIEERERKFRVGCFNCTRVGMTRLLAKGPEEPIGSAERFLMAYLLPCLTEALCRRYRGQEIRGFEIIGQDYQGQRYLQEYQLERLAIGKHAYAALRKAIARWDPCFLKMALGAPFIISSVLMYLHLPDDSARLPAILASSTMMLSGLFYEVQGIIGRAVIAHKMLKAIETVPDTQRT